MTETEAQVVGTILSGMTTDDGSHLLLKTQEADGVEVVLALPQEQLHNLIELAALGQVQSAKARSLPSDFITAMGVTWWELGVNTASGTPVLSLTLEAGGKLSFLLPGRMLASIHETIGTMLGAPTVLPPETPRN